jgi:hypothetical protein
MDGCGILCTRRYLLHDRATSTLLLSERSSNQLTRRLFAETYPLLARRLGWSVAWALTRARFAI